MDINNLLSDLLSIIHQQNDSVAEQIRSLDEQKLELQENLSNQIEELSNASNAPILIPSFDHVMKQCVEKVILNHKEEYTNFAQMLNERISTLQSKIKNVEAIKNENAQILEKAKCQSYDVVVKPLNKKSNLNQKENNDGYIAKYQKMIKRIDRKAYDELDEKNRKMDEKLHKCLIQYNKCKNARIETEERIKSIIRACNVMCDKITKSYEIRAKFEGRSNVHSFDIITYHEESITIMPAKRKSTVELGSLIILAPIKSLSRRTRFTDN